MFNLGTGGFCAPEDMGMAVCLLPGTELSFANEVRQWSKWLRPWNATVISYRTAIFRQINKDKRATHHDALEFPNGEIVLLTTLVEGQQATVLQLPAAPKSHKRRLWLPTPWIWLTRSVNPRSNKKVPTKYFVGTSRFFRPTERRYLEPRQDSESKLQHQGAVLPARSLSGLLHKGHTR